MEYFTIVTQTIGFIGVLFFLISYQAKSNRALFLLQALGCFTFCIQFALFGAYSGCLSLIINVIRNTMLTKYNSSKLVQWKGWIFVFSALCVASAIVTWNGFISWLPLIGTIVATIAFWTNNARHIRLATLFANSPCMIIFDIYIHSWAGVLNECIAIASIIISIIRFGWDNLNSDKIITAKDEEA